jgi:cytochrome b involved in lipid metabolism
MPDLTTAEVARHNKEDDAWVSLHPSRAEKRVGSDSKSSSRRLADLRTRQTSFIIIRGKIYNVTDFLEGVGLLLWTLKTGTKL